MRDAGRIDIRKTRLPSVRVWQPTEQMIEAAVLHHDDDDVLDAGAGGRRER
jgi:hypothetical protein